MSRVCVFELRCVSGVYELVSYQMRPGGPAIWGHDFQAAVTSHDAPGYGKLVGAFHSEFGQLNRGKTPPEHRRTLKSVKIHQTCSENLWKYTKSLVCVFV